MARQGIPSLIRDLLKACHRDLEPGITPHDRLVLAVIAAHSRPDGNGVFLAYPGMDTLTALTGLSRNTVRASIRRLIDAGLLDVMAQGVGRGNPTTYALIRPWEAAEKGQLGSPLFEQEKGQSGGLKGSIDRTEKGQLLSKSAPPHTPRNPVATTPVNGTYSGEHVEVRAGSTTSPVNSNDRYDAGEEGAAREGERSRDPDNKLARVVALIQAQGIKVVFNARKDARVVEDCSAGADDIAEAYVAAYRGEWNTSDGWLGRNLTMPTLVSQVPAYVAWRDSTRVAREVMGSADWPWRFERDPAWAARMFHEALHEVGYDLGTLLSPDGGTFRYSPSMPEGLRFFVEPFLQQYPDEFVDLLEHTNRQEVNGPSVSDSDPGEGMDEWTA